MTEFGRTVMVPAETLKQMPPYAHWAALISSHLISLFYRVSCSSQSIEVIYFRYKTNHVALIKFSTYLRLNRPNRLTLFLSSKKRREKEQGKKVK